MLDLHTGDGSIEAAAKPGSTIDSSWSVRTGDGTITLKLPGDVRATIDAHTGDGAHLARPARRRVGPGVAHRREGHAERRRRRRDAADRRRLDPPAEIPGCALRCCPLGEQITPGIRVVVRRSSARCSSSEGTPFEDDAPGAGGGRSRGALERAALLRRRRCRVRRPCARGDGPSAALGVALGRRGVRGASRPGAGGVGRRCRAALVRPPAPARRSSLQVHVKSRWSASRSRRRWRRRRGSRFGSGEHRLRAQRGDHARVNPPGVRVAVARPPAQVAQQAVGEALGAGEARRHEEEVHPVRADVGRELLRPWRVDGRARGRSGCPPVVGFPEHHVVVAAAERVGTADDGHDQVALVRRDERVEL